jgi:carbamate kinase
LLIWTDVDGIYENYSTPGEKLIGSIDVSDTGINFRSLDLPEGTMRPKAEACAAFVRARPEAFAIVGNNLVSMLQGASGTRFFSSAMRAKY